MFFKKYGDLVVSIFFMAISGVMIYAAKLLPKSKVMDIGPDFMPTVVGIFTLILATALLVISLKNLKAKIAAVEASGAADDSDYVRMILSTILILIYVFTLKPVGFIITTMVYLPLQMYVMGNSEQRTKKDIIRYVIISVVFTFAVFFLFRYGFKIVLPAGIFTISL